MEIIYLFIYLFILSQGPKPSAHIVASNATNVSYPVDKGTLLQHLNLSHKLSQLASIAVGKNKTFTPFLSISAS